MLEIDNQHTSHCGSPPELNASDKYVGYFENSDGDQWVLIGDCRTGEVILRGGDVGWERVYRVTVHDPYPGIVFSEPERLWFFGCLAAMSGLSSEEVVRNYNGSVQIAKSRTCIPKG